MKIFADVLQNIAAKAEENHMKQEKKQPGRLKMLAGYYKPYKGLFFADLFAFLGAAVTLVIPLMVRYIMNSISEMPAAEAKTMILKIGVGMLVLILVQLGSRYFITYYGHMMGLTLSMICETRYSAITRNSLCIL